MLQTKQFQSLDDPGSLSFSEQPTSSSFFNSYEWLIAWRKSLPSRIQPDLYFTKENNTPIAWGFFTARQLKRHLLVTAKSLFLNQTGEEIYDCLSLEQNSWCHFRSGPRRTALILLENIFQAENDIEELHLSALLPGSPFLDRDFIENQNLLLRIEKEEPAWFVNLNSFDSQESYLKLLKPVTGRRINRLLKKWRKTGPLEIREASSIQEALYFLNNLQILHNLRWSSKNKKGAFNSRFFCRFHKNLIQESFSSGKIQLLRISAGDQILGYLYNFLHNGEVCFYQCGFDYKHSNWSPGTVCHTLAIVHNKHRGMHKYNFLSGAARYKKEMATDCEIYYWAVIYRRKLKFLIENSLRQIKRKVYTRRKLKCPIGLSNLLGGRAKSWQSPS